MNLRCAFCQTPFTLSRNDKLIALQYMEAEKLVHYDAHCPRCRKATRVQRKMLEATFPNWRAALHELEVQAEASPASTPKPEAAPAPKAEPKPKATAAKTATAKPEVAQPAPKKTATKKTK